MSQPEEINVNREILLERRGRHFAYPSLGVLPGGGCVLVYHDSPARDPEALFDPDSQLAIATAAEPSALSLDSARPVPRFAFSGYHPSIQTLSAGRLLIADNSWHVYNWIGEANVRRIEDHDWVMILRGAHTLEVDASGESLKFGKPRRVTSLNYPVVGCSSPPVILDEQTVLCFADYNIDAHQLEDRPWESVVMKTTDLGKTWNMAGKIYFEPDQPDLPKLFRPCAVKTGDGKILCALSKASGEQELYFSTSEDNGETWTEPAPSGITGGGHHFTELANGRLMLSALPPDAGDADTVDLHFSDDDGATFKEHKRVLIEPGKKQPAGCYSPRPLQLPDGSLYIVFHTKAVKDTRAICGCRVELFSQK